MKRYMMFVATDPRGEPFDVDELSQTAWERQATARGVRVRGNRLRPAADATLVRVREGEVLVTAEPFTRSDEWIAALDMIETDSYDEAVDVAATHPMARFGRIELRELAPSEVD